MVVYDIQTCMDWAQAAPSEIPPPFGWAGSDQRQYTGLHYLALCNDAYPPLDYILKIKQCIHHLGPRILQQDEQYGETALHLCLWYHSLICFEQLIPSTPTLSIYNRRDETPVSLCAFLYRISTEGSPQRACLRQMQRMLESQTESLILRRLLTSCAETQKTCVL